MWETLSRELETEFEVIYDDVFELTPGVHLSLLSYLYDISRLDLLKKSLHVGISRLRVLEVNDPEPNLKIAKTHSGLQIVNSRIYDIKSKLRKIDGGGHRVHGTNNEFEYVRDRYIILAHLFPKEKEPAINLRHSSAEAFSSQVVNRLIASRTLTCVHLESAKAPSRLVGFSSHQNDLFNFLSLSSPSFGLKSWISRHVGLLDSPPHVVRPGSSERGLDLGNVQESLQHWNPEHVGLKDTILSATNWHELFSAWDGRYVATSL